MRLGWWSALVTFTFGGLVAASCTQDFDKFEPVGSGGSGGGGASVGGGGSSGTGCGANQKSCGGACVAIDDPVFGCGAVECAPCSLANGTAQCGGGACLISACNSGYQNCDTQTTNGCEVQTDVDPNNCGACGTKCKPNQTCKAGQCENNPCPNGTADCDNDPTNGCETTLGTTRTAPFATTLVLSPMRRRRVPLGCARSALVTTGSTIATRWPRRAARRTSRRLQRIAAFVGRSARRGRIRRPYAPPAGIARFNARTGSAIAITTRRTAARWTSARRRRIAELAGTPARIRTRRARCVRLGPAYPRVWLVSAIA